MAQVPTAHLGNAPSGFRLSFLLQGGACGAAACPFPLAAQGVPRACGLAAGPRARRAARGGRRTPTAHKPLRKSKACPRRAGRSPRWPETQTAGGPWWTLPASHRPPQGLSHRATRASLARRVAVPAKVAPASRRDRATPGRRDARRPPLFRRQT